MSIIREISRLPSEESQKTNHVKHDYISNLPDCVISQILSHLPTKYAVRTSVLSRDWEFKWTSIYHIKIYDRYINKDRTQQDVFVNFIERTLSLTQKVQSFCFSSVSKYYFTRMKTWISVAVSGNLHCLDISCRAIIDLPRNLLNCYSLRKLKLHIPSCTFEVQGTICFPYLTILKLVGVQIFNENPNSRLVKFNFPVLETFILEGCRWSHVKFVEIYAPKMTTFRNETPWGVSMDGYSIKTTGESLVKFDSDGFLPEKFALSSRSGVLYAALTHFIEKVDLPSLEKSGLQIRKLLKGLPNLKELELSGCATKAIALSKLGLSLPTYYKMEKLSLDTLGNPLDRFGSTEVLFELLHATPFLKFLVIDVSDLNDYDDADENVPSCVVSHLEEVCFPRYSENMNELKLVKFFLKNALQLKSMCLHLFLPWSTKECRSEIRKELRTYPKAVARVAIVVT